MYIIYIYIYLIYILYLYRNIIHDRKSLDKNQNIKPAPFLGYLSNNIECSLCHHKVCIEITD